MILGNKSTFSKSYDCSVLHKSVQPGAVILFCILGGKKGKKTFVIAERQSGEPLDIRGQLGTILTLLVA